MSDTTEPSLAAVEEYQAANKRKPKLKKLLTEMETSFEIF